MPDEAAAVRKFAALVEEARRWKGHPVRVQDDGPRRMAVWPDLEVRQVGRAVMVLARAGWLRDWWYDDETWDGDPMDAISDWLQEEHAHE